MYTVLSNTVQQTFSCETHLQFFRLVLSPWLYSDIYYERYAYIERVYYYCRTTWDCVI